jgi:hypothetical protein
VLAGLRLRRNVPSSRSTARPPARSHHSAEVPPVATADVGDAAMDAAVVVGAAEGVEVVGVADIAGVVAVALPPGDALAAVKENLPLTG